MLKTKLIIIPAMKGFKYKKIKNFIMIKSNYIIK